MFWVYIFYSATDDKYYVGQTDNLELRLKFHNELSEKSFTSKHRPWVLKRSIQVENRPQAVRTERRIKKRKSRKYLESLIKDENIVAALLAKL